MFLNIFPIISYMYILILENVRHIRINKFMSLRHIHMYSYKGQNSTDLQDQVCFSNTITFSKKCSVTPHRNDRPPHQNQHWIQPDCGLTQPITLEPARESGLSIQIQPSLSMSCLLHTSIKHCPYSLKSLNTPKLQSNS